MRLGPMSLPDPRGGMSTGVAMPSRPGQSSRRPGTDQVPAPRRRQAIQRGLDSRPLTTQQTARVRRNSHAEQAQAA